MVKIELDLEEDTPFKTTLKNYGRSQFPSISIPVEILPIEATEGKAVLLRIKRKGSSIFFIAEIQI